MRTRALAFGLYADEEGLAWVRALVEDVVGSHSARIIDMTTAPVAGTDDFLARQWAAEHPGRASGARQPVTLRLHVMCSCGRGGPCARRSSPPCARRRSPPHLPGPVVGLLRGSRRRPEPLPDGLVQHAGLP